MLRFIHCADLHIDSPFAGIRDISPEAADVMYQAPFQAFGNVIDLAIEEKVDFVIIAGDAFNAREKSLFAWLRFREQLERLNAADIQCFYCCGNHDPLDNAAKGMTLPENCIRFGSTDVEKYRFEKSDNDAVDIYGISFDRAAVTDNLSLRFKHEDMLVPAIGVLHCNVGSTGHENYAPATVEDLCAAGMDYWALGHVHSHSILRKTAPAIVYPGCIQGCSPRETGVHGCCLVTIDDGRNVDVEFRAVDVIRFREMEVMIDSCDELFDVIPTVISNVEDAMSQSGGRGEVLRISLTGRSALDDELRRGGCLENIVNEVRDKITDLEPFAWLDRIMLATTGDYDIEELRMNDDFTSELIGIYDTLEANEDLDEELKPLLESLFSRWTGSECLEVPDIKVCREICREALDMTLSRITGGGS